MFLSSSLCSRICEKAARMALQLISNIGRTCSMCVDLKNVAFFSLIVSCLEAA
jgi:hypothetical protein